MKDTLVEFLHFRKMFMSVWLLWIYRVVIVIVALVMVIGSLGTIFSGQVAVGLLTLIVGTPIALIVMRLYFELLYVIFGIFDQLKEINSKTGKKDGTG